MDEPQLQSEQQQSNLNPLLIVVIVLILGAVGVMLWLGNNKNKEQSAQVIPTTAQPQVSPTEQVGAASDSAEGATVKEISVEGGSFYFKPNEITVKKGEKVKITLTSVGGMHDFVSDALHVKSETISGGTTTVEFTPDKTGTFEFYCSIGQHRQMGMKGKLIVE